MHKVLIVDDDKLTVSLLKTLLELDGFDVISIGDSRTALQKVGDILPEAMVVDYQLADGSGIDFIKQVRMVAQFAKTPIIMASGLDREDEARAAGADHFLIKPFDPGELVKILEQHIGDKT